MGYWSYYLILFGLSYALRYPSLALGVVVLWLLRRWIPDPVVWMRTSARISSLRSAAAANPANVVARRDLAMLFLDRMRPRTALAYLDEARARAPDDAEILFLTGVARARSRDWEGSLDPLVRAVALDPRVRFGEPYLVAADSLVALGKLEEAEDALERYLAGNSSSVRGHVKLAAVRAARGDREGARKALDDAIATWGSVPGYRRRQEWTWWLRAHLRRTVT